jgi:tetratricopeptide (TPR) repeat protein
MDNAPLSPQQNAQNGLAHFQSGDFIIARDDFLHAVEGYTLMGDGCSVAEINNNLSTVYLKLKDAPSAWKAVAGSDVVFEQAGDTRRQALALGNQAAVLEALGKLDQAMEKYEACADLLKKVGDHDNRVIVLQSLSQLQLRKGRQLEAITSMQIALDNKHELGLRERVLNWLLKIFAKIFPH